MGFSTAAEQKMSGQMMFELFNNYYGLPDYADEFIRAALFGKSGAGSRIPFDFTGKPDIFRVECAQKASAYWSVWMYVIREMEDAVKDCTAGCHTCNEAPVHAWDEAWAFYAGSLEGSTGNPDGRMLYRLAEKRCKNFGTCQGPIADVNKQILDIFISGKTSLAEGRCSQVRPMITKIVNLMTVPLIQGTLRYAYKTEGGKGGPKDKAEGVAFLGAFLPRLHNCGCRHSAETDVDRWGDGGRLLHGGEEAAREELRLHGGHLQSGWGSSGRGFWGVPGWRALPRSWTLSWGCCWHRCCRHPAPSSSCTRGFHILEETSKSL